MKRMLEERYPGGATAGSAVGGQAASLLAAYERSTSDG
jgi:hypothetical protein